ncbi:MAG TPA: filamentous hemagglutinin N-terminal domain-containing protein [Polaromonas sp.]|uniref:two-partner secretion domain-containing protein n=1 Tax=Polaromonas sp. TaxID=1869339 RepID=UPI002D398503|nr:filamentous hemagglutinin N-terminal domain-containing protein [Polaromonas sp.]HYW56386.1 filamentous hemagglutinin N-terminal domain-containing protein [Polaromonas sp.]
MNRIYRTIWSASSGTCVAVAENAGGKSRDKSSCVDGGARPSRFAVNLLSACLMLTFGTMAHALPTNGAVAAGSATISTTGSTTTINQSTSNAVINWQSFGIGAGQTVQFVQPGSTSVALNRVLGTEASSIMGNLSANGRVFLLNPNGVLFGSGAQVNVGGLVASTMSLSDAKFMSGDYSFSDAGNGSVVNQGTINAVNGGHVALMGKTVSNQGVINAQLGSVALVGGQAATLDLAGDGLLRVSVAQGAVNALVENGGMIRADGGRVLLTAQAAGDLLHTAVNNTGVIQAQTIGSRDGTILLLGDMTTGTMSVGGTLDASAPNGGNGGFIDTSAAKVIVREDVRVTTNAPWGLMGTWLIDPQDFIIGPGGNISNTTLAAQLVNNNVNITTAPGPGNGDIFVNGAVEWTAAGTPTTLTLTADRDVNINAAISATEGNLVVCCGRDINVNAPITMVRGSASLSAGRNVNQNATITVTDGNLMMCAANDVIVNAKITLTRGTSIPSRSLGLPLGLTLTADTDGTGPGVAGGTVILNVSGANRPTVTGPNAPVTINYNPTSYSTPTDYSPQFILTDSTLTQRMLVFPEVTKPFDGTTSATLVSLKGNPPDVSLIADPGSTAVFNSAEVGTNKIVTFTGYRLGGANASRFALPASCCAPIVGRTLGTITAAEAAALLATVAPASTTVRPVSTTVAPASTVVASLAPIGLFLPTTFFDTPDIFLSLAEEEVVVAPPPPFVPPPPYVAPRYAPKAGRN